MSCMIEKLNGYPETVPHMVSGCSCIVRSRRGDMHPIVIVSASSGEVGKENRYHKVLIVANSTRKVHMVSRLRLCNGSIGS